MSNNQNNCAGKIIIWGVSVAKEVSPIGQQSIKTLLAMFNCNAEKVDFYTQIERMAGLGVSVEWSEYAVSRLEQPISGMVCRAMANAYTWGCEKCLYWMQRAANVGDLTAKKIITDYAL